MIYRLTIRMSLILIMFAGLMTVGVLADEPAEKPPTMAEITAAEKNALLPEDEESLAELLRTPAGVFDPEYDDDGVLLRLKIKGEAAVPRTLGAARAEIQARQSAERNARAAFVRFLREEVSVQENEREEIIIVEKNGEEQSGFNQVTTRVFESRANGLLRGLIVLEAGFSGEGASRRAVVVYGWSQKLADAARTARNSMARENNPAGRQPFFNRGGSPGTGSSGDRYQRARNINDF